MWFQHGLKFLGDLFFPPVCVNCGRVGASICEMCWEKTVFPPPRPPQIEGLEAIVALAAHRGAVREALHGLKYENLREVAYPLAERLALRIEWTFDAIIPVPLHYARLKERGYNQANLLAQALALHMNCPVLTDHLVKHKATISQVGLDAEARRANVQDVFEVRGQLPTQILLIDDVCTTGSTLGSAAQALRQAGVQRVYAATISQAS